MSLTPPYDEARTYWEVDGGNCLAGGCTGFDSVWALDGKVAFQSITRPPGADTISAAEYDANIATMVADADVWIPQQDTDTAAAQADHAALLASARLKLEAGTPLTEDEAGAIS